MKQVLFGIDSNRVIDSGINNIEIIDGGYNYPTNNFVRIYDDTGPKMKFTLILLIEVKILFKRTEPII